MEARALALISVTLLVAGGVWLFGAYALLAAGVVLLVVALLGPLNDGREREPREPSSAAATRRL